MNIDPALLLQQIENGITLGAMYALVALGYTMVYGIIELINFAHGDVFMWATVITFSLAGVLGWGNLNGPLDPLPLAGALILLLAAGMIVSAVLNVTIEFVAYRPLRKAPRLAPLIAAIGVSFILETVAALKYGTGFNSFPQIFPRGPGAQIDLSSIGLNVQINFLDIFVVLAALALMFLLNRFITTTKLGKAMRATAQDPEAASLMGVNINRTISLTFLIGGALAGAGAVLYNLYNGNVWFFTGFQLGLIAFTAAVLGGIGNIYGAVVGGFAIGLIESLAIALLPNGFAWADVTVFAILVLILVFKPSGILGQQVPDKV